MKLINQRLLPGALCVAPRVGAWIETWKRSKKPGIYRVAPRVGAWIETSFFCSSWTSALSPPAWGRGLKHVYSSTKKKNSAVAPRVGAWIET